MEKVLEGTQQNINHGFLWLESKGFLLSSFVIFLCFTSFLLWPYFISLIRKNMAMKPIWFSNECYHLIHYYLHL